MTNEQLARAQGWIVTLDHDDDYVAHYEDEEDPTHVLDAETEEEAWAELCELEGLVPAPGVRP